MRHLVRGAVGPAFDRHLAAVRELATRDPAAAAAQLFDFHVLDPACGSAHFLVEVVDELADKIATLLGEVALPAVREQLEALRARAAQFGAGIEDTALLKRLVLKRCVYGVDLSAMGVEIAKVSLWLGSFVPGLSLAYLDFNVQRGNSLIGVTRAEEVGQDTLFGDALAQAIADAAKGAAQLRAIDDTTPDLVEASRTANQALHDTVAGAQRLFDLWTAEPLGLPRARSEALLHGAELLAGAATPLTRDAEGLAERERFLHWPLAFPDVFARDRPGFDAVVGNPPWEEVTIEELAFYARYRPGLRGLATGSPSRRRSPSSSTERPELADQLAEQQQRMARLRAFFGPASGYASSGGDPDTYKLFSQRYQHLVRDGGAIGVVLPRSVFAAKGSADFRQWLFENAPPRRLDFLVNNRAWAFDIHPQYSVALVVADRGRTFSEVEVAGVADSASAFAAQTSAPGLRLRREALGTALEIPLVPTQADADLLAKLRSTGPFARGGGRWRCFPVAEFHETNDHRLWENAEEGWPLWKGASFDQFDPHGADERPCPPTPEALAKARKPRPGSGSLAATDASVKDRVAAVERTIKRARVAFRDIANRLNNRTVIACLVPPQHFLTNKAPYLAFLDDDLRTEAACLGLLNSLPFDWQARRIVERNLNFFMLEGMCVPALDDAAFDALATAAAQLSACDDRFAAFAEATDVEVRTLDSEQRAVLRADIDARVARAWNLTQEELEVVFRDFTLDAVPAAYRDRVRARFAELG